MAQTLIFNVCVSAKLNGVKMARCHIRPDTTAKNTARMAVPQKRNDLHFLTTSTYRRTQIFNSERFKREIIATTAERRGGLGPPAGAQSAPLLSGNCGATGTRFRG